MAYNRFYETGPYQTMDHFMLENKKRRGRIKNIKETIMWKDLDLEQMEGEENAYAGFRPLEEVEEIVVMVSLELYNRGLCQAHLEMSYFYTFRNVLF